MIQGIDVSKNQTRIDWERVRRSGCAFAIIRAGYQGYTQGSFQRDALFQSHIRGALEAGLQVGAYWICQALNEQEAQAAAAFCAGLLRPYTISLPVYWDMEPTAVYPRGRADQISLETRTQNGLAFLREIERQGYRGGIYTNPDHLTYKLRAEAFAPYSLWLAQWNVAAPSRPCDLWQYDAGNVPGVTGKCDRNRLYNAGLLKKEPDGGSQGQTGVVTASALRVRTGAGTQFPVLGLLPRATRVCVLEQKDGWGRIEQDGREGWISMTYVQMT